MNVRDDLFAVLQFGWDASRRAWRLLAPGQETAFAPEAVGSTGRDLEQLAFDLRRLGHDKPARMALSVAFILNGLAGQSIQFDRDLADKTSQIIAILGEMLLQLEANLQISIKEPVELVEHLRTRCGLLLDADDHPASHPRRPHFHSPDGSQPSDDNDRAEVLAGLQAVSEQLVCASESLLNRVRQESQFPHVASLSRIHHLGTTLRDQLAATAAQRGSTGHIDLSTQEALNRTASAPKIPVRVGGFINATEHADHESPARAMTADITDRRDSDGHRPLVMILDESPFFRMLLTTAIERDGYVTRAAASREEARSSGDDQSWDIVIMGIALTEPNDPLDHWLCGRLSHGHGSTITLVNEAVDQVHHGERHHHVRRTDLSSLLNLIRTILGPVSTRVRISA